MMENLSSVWLKICVNIYNSFNIFRNFLRKDRLWFCFDFSSPFMEIIVLLTYAAMTFYSKFTKGSIP